MEYKGECELRGLVDSRKLCSYVSSSILKKGFVFVVVVVVVLAFMDLTVGTTGQVPGKTPLQRLHEGTGRKKLSHEQFESRSSLNFFHATA